MMPAAMIADTASEASSIEANEASSGPHRLGHVGEPDGHGGDEPEGALGAHDDAGEIVAGALGDLAAQPHELPRARHQLQARGRGSW